MTGYLKYYFLLLLFFASASAVPEANYKRENKPYLITFKILNDNFLHSDLSTRSAFNNIPEKISPVKYNSVIIRLKHQNKLKSLDNIEPGSLALNFCSTYLHEHLHSLQIDKTNHEVFLI